MKDKIKRLIEFKRSQYASSYESRYRKEGYIQALHDVLDLFEA